MTVGEIIRVTALMVCSYNKMYGHFAGTRKGSYNKKVTMRWGSTKLKF